MTLGIIICLIPVGFWGLWEYFSYKLEKDPSYFYKPRISPTLTVERYKRDMFIEDIKNGNISYDTILTVIEAHNLTMQDVDSLVGDSLWRIKKEEAK